ncbi:hypothetical protein HZY97_10470 [Sphingomonas sp. R-74633]|uniref:hypothetical protein n=1 Tax=Sphingomonas sp. R-74633 TaxID=2751188 RepID=UPI0015D3AA12|nr:hypothetical protein [Sphingomonas sp. R-74633]NYT41182.1 hypothetical protein [Sphingomonas sp. R-74633]
MTSISSMMPRPDPRAQMDARISAAASAGSISSDDQDALSSALDTIDSSLASGDTRGGKPGDMKDKIDGLIDKQVESGALTDDQAAELKSFFAQGPDAAGKQDGDTSGSDAAQPVQGSQGPHRAHGGHHAPPPANDADSTTDDTADTDTQISAAATRQLDAMTAFLEKLRSAAASNSATYGSNAGTTSNGSSATGLVINTNA